MPSSPRVVQVTNIAPATTKDQLKTLFGFLGRIDDLVIYPTAESTNTTSKVCYVKFADADDVAVALHLTNTVFVDRALNVVAVPDGRIPDEKTALTSYYQNLASSDGTKGDEVERTVYVANLDTAVAPEILMQFFGLHAGEVKYARMAGDEGLPVRAAFIEFSEKTSVTRALTLTGEMVGSRPVTVVPSNSAIVKSVSGLEGASSREIEDALRKVNEAQPLISAAVDSDGSRRKRSRSRSRSRRSQSGSGRSRSHRSRSKKRSRSRSPRSRRRSRSRSPKPSSKPKDRKRHKSRSQSPKPGRSRQSRSRSKGRKNKGGNSPSNSDRVGYGNSKRISKNDRSQEPSRHRSRSSRSKSPVPYTSGKNKDRHRGGLEYDSRREREVDSYREGKRDKKSGDKRDHGDWKSSSKHRRHYEEQERKSGQDKAGSDTEEREVDEEEERSAAEESNDDEHDAKEAPSESDRSDQQNRSRSSSPDRVRSDEDSESAHANLSRMDMDIESD